MKLKRRRKSRKKSNYSVLDNLREAWNKLIRRNPHKKKYKELFDDTNPSIHQDLEWNIYLPKGYKVKDFFQKFTRVHFRMKDKLIIPGLCLARLLLGKYLDKDVPDVDYNKNLKIFSEEFEEAIYDWNVMFIGRQTSKGNKAGVKYFVERVKNHNSSQHLLLMKNIVLTVANTDNVYREFLNIFMFRMFQRMLKEYERYDIYKHVFYGKSSSVDPRYPKLYSKMAEPDRKKSWNSSFKVEYYHNNLLIRNREDLLKLKKANYTKEELLYEVGVMKVNWRPEDLYDSKKKIKSENDLIKEWKNGS